MSRAGLEIDADRVESLSCSGCGEKFAVAAYPPLSTIACPHCGVEQTVPARLGSFLLLKTLGRGGMGAVYKALDETLNRFVAVKVMRKEYGDDHEFLEGFLKEAQAAAALNHRNVAAIYSYGQEKGQPYIVMELLESGRLDEMINAKEPLSEAFVMDMAQHVAEGMAAAHEIGLTHGDIKPANILFAKNQVAKVVDFGLASFAESRQARPGEIWGTPYYIPPEKVKGKVSDHRGDIYSLGGTIFHALAGTAPFEGETAKDVVKARMDAPAPSIKEYRSDVTGATEAVIKRMLSRSPSRRYPTYTSLLADLRKASRAAKQAAVARKREKEAEEAAAALAAKRRPIKTSMVVVLILALLGGGAYWWVESHKEPERKVIGHILQGGVLIPVYEDDEEGAARLETVTSRDERIEESPEDKLSAKLTELAGEIAEEPSLAVMQQLANTAKALDAGDTNRFEVLMLEAVGSLLDGRPEAASPLLEEISSAGEGDGASPPAGYAEVARHAAGKASAAELDAGREAWAPETAALADLVAGLVAISKGEADAARARLEAYGKSDGDGWSMALKPVVPRLEGALDEWTSLQKSESVTKLEALLRGDGAPLRPQIEARIVDLKAKRSQAAANRKQQQEATDRKRQERDDARVKDAKSAVDELVKQQAYGKAAAKIQVTLKTLETTSAKGLLKEDEEKVQLLQSIRPFLVSELNQAPPGRPIGEVGGRVARADADKVYLASVDGGGSKAWDDLSSGLYLKLLAFYIEKGQAGAKERAKISLAVALYCEMTPGVPRNRRGGFANKAVKLDPSLEAQAKSLLPGYAAAAEE